MVCLCMFVYVSVNVLHTCVHPLISSLNVPEKIRESQERTSLMVSEKPLEIWVLLSTLAPIQETVYECTEILVWGWSL